MVYSRVSMCLVLFLSLSFGIPWVIAADSQTTAAPLPSEWLVQRMDLNCDGRPLQEVMEDIAAFFQTEIVYEAEGADQPIQCRFSQITVEQALDRLFRKQNRAILIEYLPKRKITVQVFGVSEYNIVSNDGSNRVETLPFLADMTNDALAALQNEQYNAYQNELNDPNAIVHGVGITRSEMTKLHQQQIEQQKNQNNPDQIVPGTTITQQQLTTIQEYQLDQYEKEKEDKLQPDPFTGLTAPEIKELHQQQTQQ